MLFIPTLFPYFLLFLPYMSLIFTQKILPLVSILFSNTANSPNEVAKHAVYTCCTVNGCNIVYTYLCTTAANEVTHLPIKFTLYVQENLGGYFVINR